MGDDEIVLLTISPNEPLALMWAETLREAGIKTMLKPLGPGFGAWASAATLEHELYVLAADLEPARAIMAELDSEDEDQLGEER